MVGFADLAIYIENYGIMDFLLPFILVFTIIFAVMQKIKLFGDNKKNFNVIIALVLALLFVVPHITGGYPSGYDPVQIMNEAIPSISLVAVAAIMLMLLLGIFGKGVGETLQPIIAVAAIIFVIYIFGSSLNLWVGPSDIFYWWDSDLTELLLIILVFGAIVWFITKEPGDKGGNKIYDVGKGLLRGLTRDLGDKK